PLGRDGGQYTHEGEVIAPAVEYGVDEPGGAGQPVRGPGTVLEAVQCRVRLLDQEPGRFEDDALNVGEVLVERRGRRAYRLGDVQHLDVALGLRGKKFDRRVHQLLAGLEAALAGHAAVGGAGHDTGGHSRLLGWRRGRDVVRVWGLP